MGGVGSIPEQSDTTVDPPVRPDPIVVVVADLLGIERVEYLEEKSLDPLERLTKVRYRVLLVRALFVRVRHQPAEAALAEGHMQKRRAIERPDLREALRGVDVRLDPERPACGVTEPFPARFDQFANPRSEAVGTDDDVELLADPVAELDLNPATGPIERANRCVRMDSRLRNDRP
jgi:hypothetical protein